MISSAHGPVVPLVAAVLLCPYAGPAVAAPEASPPEYSLTVWAAENAEPPGDVFAIAQDVEGYLWLGTPGGLLRFDGSRFIRWPPDPGEPLPSGPVHAIVADPDGSLWVGFGGGGGVVHLSDRETVRFSPDSGAPAGVTDMIRDREGAIWVAARRGIFRYAGGVWSLMTDADGYPGGEAFGLLEDRSGRIWVGTASGVFRRTGGRFELVDGASRNVQGLVEDGAGRIWVTDPDRLARRLPERTEPRPAPGVRLPSGAWRLLHDSQGQIWAASFGSGLLRIADTGARVPVIERFEYEHRLAGSPRAVFEDRDRNIWVGMRGGLLRLRPSSFVPVRGLDGLNNDGVRTATVGPDGSVWVATGHAVNRFQGASRVSYPVAQTMALHADRRGRVWIATSQDIGELVNGRIRPLPLPDEVRPSRVIAMTSDARDWLWFCSSLRGVSAWDGTHLKRFDDSGVSGRACQSILTDSRGRVWVGFLGGGVAVLDSGGFRTFGQTDGITPGTVLAILEDQAGGIWFGTSAGVCRYFNGRITALTRAHAPLADLVPVLLEDADGGIWIGVNSGAGIVRVHRTEVDKLAASAAHAVEYLFFDESDGLQQGSQTWQSGVGGVRAPDGTLWVATGLGMAIIDPRSLPPHQRPMPPKIDAVTVDGRRMMPEAGLRLPSWTSTLAVEFSTVSLSGASKVRFRYMLDGVDEAWVHAGTAREARYMAVPAGDHRFRVSATSTGAWTESTTWAFVVAPPFYRTRGFVLLAAGSVALLVVLAWWLRLRSVRHQYALVFAERARVSREIHDTLLQSLAAMGVELDSIAAQLTPAQASLREAVKRLRRRVARSVREARESILELRHTPMEQRQLPDVLRDLAAGTTRRTGLPADVAVEGRPRAVDPDIDLQLLRICQEAVQNAIKHAGAGRIGITLRYEPARIVLRVTDDGRGFEPAAFDPPPPSGEHLGLVTMRERAARVRGLVAIASRPGGGTTVEASIPLPPGRLRGPA